MKTTPTPTGWIETVVTEHKIVLAKTTMSVETWNAYNLRNTDVPYSRIICNRCKTFWSSIPGNQNVVACQMEKGIGMSICEQCASEIDQSLIIK